MGQQKSRERTQTTPIEGEASLLKKGFEVMFSPEKAEAEYIKRKGKPMDSRTELCFLIFFGIVIIVIMLLIFVIGSYTNTLQAPSGKALFFLLVFFLVFSWFSTFNYLRKKRRATKTPPWKHSQHLNVRCPHCNNIFQIPQQQKPAKIECPKCGGESRLR